MRTLLVTGGCGFIGCHFVRCALAASDLRVVNLDNLTYAGHLENLQEIPEGPQYRFAKGDIADRGLVDALVREERPWAIVNFAAESHVDRSILDSTPFLRTNVLGVQVLLEVARTHGVERFVQISTDEVYGDAEGQEPFDEEHALQPRSPYAASKAAADLLCLAYHHTHGLPVLIIRSSNNFGPFQFPEKLIPFTIRNAVAGRDLPLYGDGQHRRDWIYVEDNVEAIFTALQLGQTGAVYNVATGEERSNLSVARKLCALLAEIGGMDEAALVSRIQFVADRPGHDRRYAMSARRAREELGWVPRVPFEAGLARTVRWYLDRQDWIARVITDEYQTYYDAVYVHAWGHPRDADRGNR